jgi:hypothetical protein
MLNYGCLGGGMLMDVSVYGVWEDWVDRCGTGEELVMPNYGCLGAWLCTWADMA